MTPRFSVFVATSLDGFIAREDGRIDWLNEANARVPDGEDCGYAAFLSGVDGLVMGRATFEHVLSFETWPYEGIPVYVLSGSMDALPVTAPSTAVLLRGTPPEVAAILHARGHRHLYLDGGNTIQRFLAAGLVSELTITTVPVLLGAGRSLFGRLPADIRLVHRRTHAYPFGFVQSHYAVPDAT